LRSFPAHVGPGQSAAVFGWQLVAFARAGAALLVISRVDYSIRLCSLFGETLKIFRGHEQGIASLAVSADGEWFLTGSADGTARLWSLEDGEMHVYRGHPATVTAVEFASDNERIFTIDEQSTVRSWARKGAIADLLRSGELEPLSVASELAYGLLDPGQTLHFDSLARLYEAADYVRFRLEQTVSLAERQKYEPLVAAIEDRVLARVIEGEQPEFPTTAWRNRTLKALANSSAEKLLRHQYSEARRVAGMGERISVEAWDAEAQVDKTLLEILSLLAPVYAGDPDAMPRLNSWLSGATREVQRLAGQLVAHLARKGLVCSDLQALSGS